MDVCMNLERPNKTSHIRASMCSKRKAKRSSRRKNTGHIAS